MLIKLFRPFILLILSLGLLSCTGLPDKIKPVDSFELDAYLGKWHEVARLPHSFEEDMNQVTAEYQLNQDGSVKVINRGFNLCEQKWDKAEGNANFVDEKSKGYLKVSFFGPFYGSYVVFELGPKLNGQYQYSFVSGPNTDYLWLLSRTKDVSAQTKQAFIKKAKQADFNTNKVIWVNELNQCEQ
ncbi:lipocalin family protein [Catenovulum adriaticum]|uniref:Outer membrane lipoprotein Blc n=1 Tax=Catenovulum adriaticum TaxID=2984846 RepID=A0ABY7AKX2_9ALTE|nr:lipocalin family protein [Catenovulum sp. TS8]WAJ70119.1 lipocalin family protein [Catenovulum sp. TS8]